MKSEYLPIFAAFALSASCIVVASLVLFASLLLFVVVVWVVVGGPFSLRMIATKKKGQAVCLSSLRGCGLVICLVLPLRHLLLTLRKSTQLRKSDAR